MGSALAAEVKRPGFKPGVAFSGTSPGVRLTIGGDISLIKLSISTTVSVLDGRKLEDVM